MILAIDVGNTNIVAAVMEDGQPLYVKRYETGKKKSSRYHGAILDEFLEISNEHMEGRLYGNIEGAIISSVVPEVNESLSNAVRKCTGLTSVFVSNEIETGLTIKYVNPSKLGADLITGAAGAVEKFGCPMILIDIGTATTFSVINEKAEYIGGMIAPGPYTSLSALVRVASLLPADDLTMTDEVIGTDTRECMSIGTFTGHAAMIDGMIDRVEEKMGLANIKLVATGGPARDITKLCKREIECDRDLILYGLYHIYNLNKGGEKDV